MCTLNGSPVALIGVGRRWVGGDNSSLQHRREGISVKFAPSAYGWHHDVHKFIRSRGGEEAVSAEENKALVRRFVDEAQSQGNTDLIDEICSPEFVNHSAPPGLPPDREGIKILAAMFRGAFPDSYFTVEDMIGEGDKIATRKTFHGTHEGEFMGIPPTGRRVSIGLIDIVRVSGGRVVEHWSMGDNLGMMQQLGVIAQQGAKAEPSH